jgi:2-polyprenyl-6-methoxyphenol hydroxylase-like FAD-dependent oxidoreductase
MALPAESQPSTHKRYGQAVVIGASITGLVTARVLSEHFQQVTVLERDQLPDTATARKGAPQARHAHVLLTRGQRALNQLFPGFENNLAQAGAVKVDWGYEGRLLGTHGWSQPGRSDLISYACSRDLLEYLVRRRVQQCANVAFATSVRVENLTTTPERSRVIGVQCAAQDSARQFNADLVVDTSGRSSRLPIWLKELGYDAPAETIVNSRLGYATRWYQIPPGFQADWRGILISARPPHMPRGGLVLTAEDNRWVVTLAGYCADYPPIEESGFLEFVRSLPSPLIYDLIKDAEPLTPVYGYQRTENMLRHYEALARLPDGVVALGDAVCAFNPVYGQGMSMGALGALELDVCLRQEQGLVGLPQRFQKRLAKRNTIAWALATSEDFRWPGTTGGQRSTTARFFHGYVEQLTQMQSVDPAIARLFWSIAHLVTPPTALFAPAVVAKVARHWLHQRFA